MKLLFKHLFTALAFAATFWSCTKALHLTVSNRGDGLATSPLLYGLLWEDVYHSGDGGIYGEMIQNRAMQGPDLVNNEQNRNLARWHNWPGCDLELDNSSPTLSSALPYQMSVAVPAGRTGTTGMWNEGFAGFNVTTTTRYAASFWLRGTFHGNMEGAFWSNTTGGKLASTTFAVSQDESQGWTHYGQVFMVPQAAPDYKNTFHLTFDAGLVAGRTIYVNMVSVWQQTLKDGKLRMDLGNALNNLGGKFLRFPGGNNLEGIEPPNRWIWSNTVGPIENRPGRPGTWGYWNTDGLGLLDQMDWCTSMNLEPILAVWGGYYLNGNHIAQGDLQPYVDDVMNELEFLMGDKSTKYGGQRDALSYAPYNIKYIEIGNEDWFDGSGSYQNYRFNMFYNAIHAKYPSINIISSLCIDLDLPGPSCQPSTTLNNPPAGVVADLHLYQSSDDTVKLFSAFDHISRDHPILIGEYAAIYRDSEGGNTQLDMPTLQSATAEAVMFLGLERNSDLVIGVAHGALMKSLNDAPNNVAIIKHNADTLVLSYTYFVTQIFAHNFGTKMAPTTSDSNYGPLYWSSTVDNGKYYVKVVNYKGADSTPVTVTIEGSSANEATLITLTGPNASSTNTLGSSTHSLTETTVRGGGGTFSFTLSGSYVVAVLVVQT